MKDFEFDGKTLSSFGCVVANFGDKGLETIDGIKSTFNTVSTLSGSKSELTSVEYEDNLEKTIQIVKYDCSTDIQEITEVEYRNLTSWLCRKKYLKFKVLDGRNIDLYHEVKIDVSKIEIDDKLYGLELTIQSNRPYALKEPKTITIKNIEIDGKHSINDTSYEEGHIYPKVEITIGDIGTEKKTLIIYNEIENRKTTIKNCVANEVITMDYPVIESNNETHNKTLQNDFNWNFFRIANTYENSRNDLTISLPCSIKIEYSPIVKVGL